MPFTSPDRRYVLYITYIAFAQEMTLQIVETTHVHNNCLDTNVLTLLSWSVLMMCYQSRLWDERGRERFISPS